MRISVWENVVDFTDIKSISKKLLCVLDSSKIPIIGEILYLESLSKGYEVCNLIRVVPDDISEETFSVEVRECKIDLSHITC